MLCERVVSDGSTDCCQAPPARTSGARQGLTAEQPVAGKAACRKPAVRARAIPSSADGTAIPDRDSLYEELGPLVQWLLHRFGKTPELRQDLEGEIYCRFCRLVSDYNPNRGIPIRPYLIRMLKQTVFNYVRDYWRYQNRCIPIQIETGEDRVMPALVVSPEAVRRVLEQELQNALPGAIAALPRRQRLVVAWRFYEGRSFEEIGQALEIQPSSARSLLRHGLNALRRYLKSAGLLGD